MTTPADEPDELGAPEAPESQLFDREVQQILGQIDRPKFMGDERLTRVRHPLLQERLGADVALNTEIHNMVCDLVTGITADDSISNKDQLAERAKFAEELLADCSTDPSYM